MIVNNKYKFIFLKTRKTAGSSVEIALADHCGPDDIIAPMRSEGIEGQNHAVGLRHWSLRDTAKAVTSHKPMFQEHSPARDVRQWVGAEIWNSYFKFSVERNPWSRFVSQFFWNTRAGGSSEGMDIREYFEKTEFWRKSNWKVYAIGDEVVTDFVVRHETLEADLATVTDKLGMPRLELPHAKSNIRKNNAHYSEILPSDIVEEISKICAREIAHFGYTFETAPRAGS